MRILPLDDDGRDTRVTALFDRARATYRWLPNTVRVMARGSGSGELYLTAGALNRDGSCGELERELLAVTTAAFNRCDYCLTAHSLAARALGASEEDVLSAQAGRASDPRTDAMLQFARAVLRERGRVHDDELVQARRGGLDDRLMLDIVSVVVENTLGNFVNNIAETELDGVLERALPKALPRQRP